MSIDTMTVEDALDLLRQWDAHPNSWVITVSRDGTVRCSGYGERDVEGFVVEPAWSFKSSPYLGWHDGDLTKVAEERLAHWRDHWALLRQLWARG